MKRGCWVPYTTMIRSGEPFGKIVWGWEVVSDGMTISIRAPYTPTSRKAILDSEAEIERLRKHIDKACKKGKSANNVTFIRKTEIERLHREAVKKAQELGIEPSLKRRFYLSFRQSSEAQGPQSRSR